MALPLTGIDISSHNGNVNFTKVKRAGIDFAILRAGYGSDNPSQDDSKFKEHVQGCELNAIPWGAYLYSYACTVEEAKSEAAHMLRMLNSLNGEKPTFPVYIDMEDADGYKAKRGVTNKRLLTDICLTFCDIITKAGYTAGVYANKDWLENKLFAAELDKYTTWLAVWYDPKHGAPVYNGGSWDIWQYTSDGKVDGISGRVDLNLSYKEFVKPAPKPEPPKVTPTKGLKVGDKVKYQGTLHGTSYGGSPGAKVNGTFTVTRIIPNRIYGVLLNNGIGWVAEKDCKVDGVVTVPTPSTPIKKGDRVVLSKTATHYQTGQAIPKQYLGKTYTVQELGTNRVLLKELYSWVHSKDVRKV